MKRTLRTIIVALSLTAIMGLMAQDVAGDYKLSGLNVTYHDIARVTTPIMVTDTYGMGVSLQISEVPGGSVFYATYNGPHSEAALTAVGVNLNVEFYEDGTAYLVEGTTYPDVEEENCITSVQVLPLTDDMVYTSNMNAGLVVQPTNIIGIPSTSTYVGQTLGSMSLSQAAVFDYFPATPTTVSVPFPIYIDADGDGAPDIAHAPGADLPGQSVGYAIKGDDLISLSPDNASIDNNPDLYFEWHAIDGEVSESGLGVIIGEDEDGDGTDFDRTFGLPYIAATHFNPAPACGGFNYPVVSDVSEVFTGVAYNGCIDAVATETTGQCEAVLAGGVAQCMYDTGYDEATCASVLNGQAGGAAGLTVEYLANTIIASLDPPLYETCMGTAAQVGGDEALAVALVSNNLCLSAGFDQENCDVLVDLVTLTDLDQDEDGVIDSYGITDCQTLSDNSAALAATSGALVQSTDEDGSGTNCDEWALAVADSFAAQSADTGYLTCTDFSANWASTCIEEVSVANDMYIMDAALATWGNFLTYNSAVFSATLSAYMDAGMDENSALAAIMASSPELLADDSDHDFDGVNGRLVMHYAPTCIPEIESRIVSAEFHQLNVECSGEGDVNSDGNLTVLDIVATVGYILGDAGLNDVQLCNGDLTDDDTVDVLDVVAMVANILGRGHSGDATSVELIKSENGLGINADGFVGAVQLTLSHGENFSIDLTTDSFFGDFEQTEP